MRIKDLPSGKKISMNESFRDSRCLNATFRAATKKIAFKKHCLPLIYASE